MKTRFRSSGWAGAKFLLAALAIGSLSLQAAGPSVTTVAISGSDFYNGTMSNVVLDKNALELGDDTTPTTFSTGFKLFGIYTSGELNARSAFQSLSFNYQGDTSAKNALTCAVRTEADGVWSTWIEVPASQLGKPLTISGSSTAWQYRISFYANTPETSPKVRSVTARLYSNGDASTAARVTTLAVAAASTHPTYRIYATREGLVGNRTANGHVIVSRDHFVALPSSTVLDCNGCSTYTVTLSNPANGLSVTEKIYDVGPWNTSDNYWHFPRAEFNSLDVGLPEAQAAYQNGFNGGKDESGRTVSNPAGIDLADGTFWDSLGLVGNSWIDVTFNMETLTSSVTVDNTDAGFSTSANWSTGTSSTDKFGTNYRYRSTAALSDPATWSANLGSTKSTTVACWYPQGSNRSTTSPYIVYHAAGSTSVNINQQINGGQWVLLGTFNMNAGVNNVKLSCWTTTGSVVVADAIRWTQ